MMMSAQEEVLELWRLERGGIYLRNMVVNERDQIFPPLDAYRSHVRSISVLL
jgi:hypothetical protein